MLSPKLTTRLFWAFESLLLVGALALTAALWRSADWKPPLLAVLLVTLTVVGGRLAATIGTGVLSTAHVGLTLAMSLLGPAPAVCFGLFAISVDSALRRVPRASWLNNLCNFATFPLVGALLVRAYAGDVHAPHNHLTTGLGFGLVMFAAFIVTLLVNFLLVALDMRVSEGRGLRRQVREVFLPVLPGHLATAILAGLIGVAYTNFGLSVLFAAVLVLLIFQYLTMALLRSEDRADQLEARSIQLASMQFGMLSTLMEALAKRNPGTARHAASVARYAKALAVELGCSEEEQELIHSAALLHDIGKFTLPDRILHAELLSDDDWTVVRRHPQDGAALVGKLDGYGPVADAILYHHEQIDGGGYPAGLIGHEIPLASRIIAICSTYDTLTANDTYRDPHTPEQAIEELQRVAGTQLDKELVDTFVAMLQHDGTAARLQREQPDFATELSFERRVRHIAMPSGK